MSSRTRLLEILNAAGLAKLKDEQALREGAASAANTAQWSGALQSLVPSLTSALGAYQGSVAKDAGAAAEQLAAAHVGDTGDAGATPGEYATKIVGADAALNPQKPTGIMDSLGAFFGDRAGAAAKAKADAATKIASGVQASRATAAAKAPATTPSIPTFKLDRPGILDSLPSLLSNHETAAALPMPADVGVTGLPRGAKAAFDEGTDMALVARGGRVPSAQPAAPTKDRTVPDLKWIPVAVKAPWQVPAEVWSRLYPDGRAQPKAPSGGASKSPTAPSPVGAPSGPGKLTPADEKRRSLVQEIEDRRRNIKDNVAALKAQIEDTGTFELTGPASQDMERRLNNVATDLAKLADPSSVARPSEVEAARKGLIPTGWKALGMSNATAQQILDNLDNEVDARADNAYKVRGIPRSTDPMSSTPITSMMSGNSDSVANAAAAFRSMSPQQQSKVKALIAQGLDRVQAVAHVQGGG